MRTRRRIDKGNVLQVGIWEIENRKRKQRRTTKNFDEKASVIEKT